MQSKIDFAIVNPGRDIIFDKKKNNNNNKQKKQKKTLCIVLMCYMSPVTRKPVFGVSDGLRLKLICSASETS